MASDSSEAEQESSHRRATAPEAGFEESNPLMPLKKREVNGKHQMGFESKYS